MGNEETPGKMLHILFLEDFPDDAFLAECQLRSAGLNFVTELVDNRQDFLKKIHDFAPDIIISDYSLPGFDALEALSLVRETTPEIPFILLTGSQTEETAVECLKQGADDYILKSSLARLPSAVVSAIQKREGERDKQKAIAALRSSEESLMQLKIAVEALQVGVTIADSQRRIIYINPAEAKMHGWEVTEMLGQDARMCAPQEIWKPIVPLEEMKSYKRESVNTRKDGTLFAVELISDVVCDTDGRPAYVITICEEITERKRMEKALRESEERYALAATGANEGLWDWDLIKDEVYYSPRWKSMLGFAENELKSDPGEWFQRVHPDDIEHLKSEIELRVYGVESEFESEYRILHKDGRYCWMLNRGLVVRDSEGVGYRMAGSQTDITARKQAEAQLIHDALHDSLTGLPNRTLFMERLTNAIDLTRRREQYGFALLFMDLDRFKNINDSLGHVLGDEMLISVGRRLQRALRPGDAVARFGGDEFAVFLDDVSSVVGAVRVASRIQKDLSQPFQIGAHEVFTSASIGITLSERRYNEPGDMLRDADIAMYRAKAQGCGRHELFDTAMRTRAVRLLEMETDLRKALERREFELHYQPIVDLLDHQIDGFEALIRWRHPQLGLLYPAEFLSVAEETGLIVPIGDWVLNEACSQILRWQQDGLSDSWAVSVNVSGKQLSQPDLASHVNEILQENGVVGSRLKLELTETSLIENTESAKNILSRLKDLSIGIHLDDFGTGYSSLSYLHRFPIDTLKIDRSFINSIGATQDTEIVRTILSLAHTLNMGVIAEGIETSEHVAALKDLGCRQGQGYYFMKPMPPMELQRLIAS